MKRWDVVVAILHRGGKVLICQRRMEDRFGGLWEFPGGKREGEESLEACLRREVREELGIEVRPLRVLESLDHEYPDIHVRLIPFLCQLERGEPRALAAQQVRWVELAELKEHAFPPANTELIAEIARGLFSDEE